MVEEQNLRWSSHRVHLMEYIDSLQRGENFVDVTLVCEEVTLRAHRVILSACSSFLKFLLATNPCDDPVIFLQGIKGWQLQSIVDFMYRGTISVDQDCVDSLVEVAEMLQVRGLSRSTASDFRSLLDAEPQHDSAASPCATMRHLSDQPFFSGYSTDPPLPRRKQARPRRRSGDCDPVPGFWKKALLSPLGSLNVSQDMPEDLSLKKSPIFARQGSEEKDLATHVDTALPILSETESVKSETNSSGPCTPNTSHSNTSPLPLHQDRRRGQHSAPRGGPPRAWTNADLTEALHNVWNRKMTTSQASRVFGIPYNSLLMYVRGKYGKSLKLDALRKETLEGEAMAMAASTRGSYKLSPTPATTNSSTRLTTTTSISSDLKEHQNLQANYPLGSLASLAGLNGLAMNPYLNYLCDFSFPVPMMNLLSGKMADPKKTTDSNAIVSALDVAQV